MCQRVRHAAQSVVELGRTVCMSCPLHSSYAGDPVNINTAGPLACTWKYMGLYLYIHEVVEVGVGSGVYWAAACTHHDGNPRLIAWHPTARSECRLCTAGILGVPIKDMTCVTKEWCAACMLLGPA